MHRILSVLVAAFVFVLAGCVKNNPDPSWLYIEPWILNDNPDLQEGVLSQQVTDAWVYVGEDLLGVFELPIKVPVLKEGEQIIKIFPAIVNNGISATKKMYPFMEKYEVVQTLTKNKIDTLQPETQYIDGLNFWIEDFEQASVKIRHDDLSATLISQDNEPEKLKYGSFYGSVKLNATDSTWIAFTDGQLPLPRGPEVYLEIDFRSTNSLVTGLLEVSTTYEKNNVNIQLNPQEPGEAKWKKIYIDLRELIINTPQAEFYEISFVSFLDVGETETEVIIDNIKLVYP